MNAIELAHKAYAPTAHPLKSERDVEAQLIGKITARLRRASQHKDNDFPGFVQAIHQNREMWAAFAVDVASDGNNLPKELRAQMFYLAQFTDLHSSQVLRGEANIDPLIDINVAILRGLNGSEVR